MHGRSTRLESVDPTDPATMIDMSPLPLLAVSLPDMPIRTANTAAASYFGLTRAELVDRNLTTLLASAQVSNAKQAMSPLATGSIDEY
jgi:hypothetical protein